MALSKDSIILEYEVRAGRAQSGLLKLSKSVESLGDKSDQSNQKLNSSLDELGQSIREVQGTARQGIEIDIDTKDLDRLADKVKDTHRPIDDIGKFAQDSSGRVRGLGRRLGTVSQIAKGFLTARLFESAARGLFDLAKAPTQLAANFEESRISFKTLLGSYEEADKLLNQLSEYDVRTPFDPAELQSATQTLLGFGSTAEQSFEQIQLLGDAAASSGQANIESLARIFGQVQSLGKLDGEKANQFIDQGVPIYDLLAESTGKSISQLKELQSQSKITGKDVEEAFRKASAEGGKFFGAVDAQAESLKGLTSTFTGNIGQIGQRIGRVFAPFQKELLKIGNSITGNIVNKLTPIVQLIENNIGPVIERLREILSPAFTTISNGLKKIFGDFKDSESIVASFFQRILQIGSIVSQAFDVVQKAVSPITEAFGRLSDSFSGAVSAGSAFSGVMTTLSRALVLLGQGLGFVIGLYADYINYLRTSDSLYAKSARSILSLSKAFATNLPGAIAGIIEALKQFASNFSSNLKILALDAKLLVAEFEGIFSEKARQDAEELRNKIEELRDSQISVVDAFKKGKLTFEAEVKIEIPDFEDEKKDEKKNKKKNNNKDDDDGGRKKKRRGQGDSEAKTIDDLLKRLSRLREQREIKLKAGLVFEAGDIEAEIRKVAGELERLRLIDADQSLEALSTIRESLAKSLKDFISDEDFFFAGLVSNELEKIDSAIDKVNELKSSIRGESSIELLPRRSEIRPVQSEPKKRSVTEEQLEVIALERELRLQAARSSIDDENELAKTRRIILIDAELEELKLLQSGTDARTSEYQKRKNAILDLIDERKSILEAAQSDEKPFIQSLLGLDNEQFSRLQSDYSTAKGFIQGLLDEKVAAVDAEIELQKNRVDEINKIASDGNAEQLQIEEERLERLNKEREKAVRRKQALANIELAVNQALAISETAKGLGSAIGAGFPAALIAVPLMIALIAQVSSAVSGVSSLFGGINLWEGTDYSVGQTTGTSVRRGRDQVRANIDIDERVLAKKYNDPIKDVHSRDIPRYVLMGKRLEGFKLPDINYLSKEVLMTNINNENADLKKLVQSQNQLILNQKKSLERQKRHMSRIETILAKPITEVTVDQEGFAVRSRELILKEEKKRQRFG